MSETIGRYRIVARLGRGRLGAVYQAFDPRLQRSVALRVIRWPAPDDPRRTQGFAALQSAVGAAAMLDHPNIAAVHEHGETELAAEGGSSDGQLRAFYIASALVDGESLASRLASGVPIGPGTARQWLTQILLALDHAHARGVVHADLKPANVLITADDEIRVTDFGLNCGDARGAGGSGSILENPEYLAPEQLLDEPVDARSDLYACGILLYQMLTGRQPFRGAAADVMEQILTRDPPPPSQLQGGLGTAFDDVVARALARRPERRLASADQFLLALNRTVPQRSSSADDEATERLPAAAGKPIGTPRAPSAEDWRVAAAAPLEAALATAVGPIARVLVRNALTGAATFEAACDDLAARITEPVARQAFVAAAQRSRAVRAIREDPHAAESPATPAAPGISPAPSPGGLIDQAMLQAATERLSDDVGPIARIIVDRSLVQAGSRAEFFRLLAAWIPTTRQRQEFLRQFGVGE